MSDRILVYPDPRLRQKAEPVAEITPEVRERALGLVRLMNEGNGETGGIGLAATQVGWPVRIMVVKTPNRDGTAWEDSILVNPRVESVGPAEPEIGRGPRRVTEVAIEGCLSFPGIEVKVERYCSISVEAKNLDGQTRWYCAEGIVARCLQHELDHIDGITMIDRLTPARRVAVARKLRELEERA